MLKLAQAVVLGGASAACGFAAVGLLLYAASPAAQAAALLFGMIGFVAGMLCALLHAVFERLPLRKPAMLSAHALARKVRAALAGAAAERTLAKGRAGDPVQAPQATPVAEGPAFGSSAFGA